MRSGRHLSELKCAATVRARQQSIAWRRPVERACVAVGYEATPVERVAVSRLGGDELTTADRAAILPSLVRGNERPEPQQARVVIGDLAADAPLHHFLGVGEAERVEGARPQQLVVDEDELLVHVELAQDDYAPAPENALDLGTRRTVTSRSFRKRLRYEVDAHTAFDSCAQVRFKHAAPVHDKQTPTAFPFSLLTLIPATSR
jgi:hypothetical protein